MRLRFNRRGVITPLWGVESCTLPSRRSNSILTVPSFVVKTSDLHGVMTTEETSFVNSEYKCQKRHIFRKRKKKRRNTFYQVKREKRKNWENEKKEMKNMKNIEKKKKKEKMCFSWFFWFFFFKFFFFSFFLLLWILLMFSVLFFDLLIFTYFWIYC